MPTKTRPQPMPTNADLMLYAAEAEECRRSFKAFVRAAWLVLEPGTPLRWSWHMDALCEHLQAVIDGQITRLVINIAPGHTKSTIVSQAFTAWGWTRDPHIRWLCASTDLGLAIRDNRQARYLIESEWYRGCYGREFHVNQTAFDMSADQNMKSYFENDHKGYRQGLSVGAKGIGKRGSHLIIDDPHDPREGDAGRQEVLDWYAQTWVSRLNDQEHGAMITVGQRIHDEDLCGHLLKLGGCEHLCLPEEFEPPRRCTTSIGWCDPRDQEGELLWPEKFPLPVLENLKKSLGSLGFSAQYQQSPIPAKGGQVKREWMRYHDSHGAAFVLSIPGSESRAVAKSDCWTFATVDLAISSKQSADFTVIALWAVTTQNDLILFDLVRAHMDNPAQQRALEMLHERYRPRYILVEAVAYQLALVQQLLNRGVPCRAYHPVRDKVSRFSTAAIWYENGKIYHPMRAAWLADFEEELLKFPKAAHDDCVDVVSMAAEQVVSPMGPLIWSPDDGQDTPASLETAPSDGKQHLLVTIDDPEITFDEGEMFDGEVGRW